MSPSTTDDGDDDDVNDGAGWASFSFFPQRVSILSAESFRLDADVNS
jgi:hypothetical protein